MAAAARPPGLGDARVPCPLCGGLIHPVAGRCKHCKEDLTQFRAGRPQAATPLPSLVAAPPVAPVVNGRANGHAVAPVPIAVPVREASQPILPPRPTGRSIKAQRPRGSLLKNWPMIVIVLAGLAIVAAVVIMVMPTDNEARDGKRNLMVPPAPDRMETNPVQPPRSGQIDPWGSPDDPVPAPQQMPDPPDPVQPADPDDDLWGGLGGGGGGGGGGGVLGGMYGGLNAGALSGTFMLTIVHHACKKLQSCPNIDQSTLGPVCSQFSALPRPPMPANCRSAQRCIDAIDDLDCDANIDNPVVVLTSVQECVKAATEC